MLYEMVGIVRPGKLAEVKEIALAVGQIILNGGGVVRSIANWGVYDLPNPIVRHQIQHRQGHYFVMRYDSSTNVHEAIRNNMRLDPRVVRSGHVKLGDGKLSSLVKYGPIHWKQRSNL
ncbi:37S ribosomal protein MRP17, mitochondrial [Ceratocystis lukuohia]|uniref:Small ribosomal subunit protein bS6m n=2 Tax=Ceratocystis TaxID=5157 RepID=A0A2C5X126_9PEZI|nr:37S ribosomal protein MRP17, mitochondrial [Ceratocystis fimbriata CBS 114723]